MEAVAGLSQLLAKMIHTLILLSNISTFDIIATNALSAPWDQSQPASQKLHHRCLDCEAKTNPPISDGFIGYFSPAFTNQLLKSYQSPVFLCFSILSVAFPILSCSQEAHSSCSCYRKSPHILFLCTCF